VAFVELESGVGMDLSGEVSILGVWGDESDEADLASEGEELGHLSDTADVLGTVLSREAKVLVKSLSDDIAIEDENLLGVANEGINLDLEGIGEGGLAGTRETSEPVSGTVDHGVGSGSRFSRNHLSCCFLEC